MKVIQVVPTIENESAGPSYYMIQLNRALEQQGVSIDLHSLERYTIKECFILNLGRSPEMYQGLKTALPTANIIHNNSLWMMPNLYPYWVAKRSKVKVVTSPHGTFSPWALKKGRLKKFIFGTLLQYPALKRTDMFHATCEKEYQEIRAMGYKQPVAIVPIGMDLPEDGGLLPVDGGQSSNSELKKIVFFGRIHKVKAVDHLVRAWGALHADLPEWELVIAGPDCGAQDELEAIIATEKIPRVRFVGEINGPAKYDFLKTADLYVLPSHTENFGVTVAEALVCNTPVIASQGTPWEGLETEGCGKWIPIGVAPLVDALRELIALSDEERQAMGLRGRDWIRREFSWEGVGAKMKAAYAWLLGQGEKPDWVKVD